MWLLLALSLALAQTRPAMSDRFLIDDGDAFANVVAPDAAVRKLAGDFQFTEGPAWRGGTLYFSDIPSDVIHTWTPAGGVGVFRQPAFNPNGSTFDNDGHLITCEHGARVVSIALGNARMALTEGFDHDGRRVRFNSPNDVVVKRDGTIWFTDPPYGIKRDLMEYGGQWVFRYDPRDKSVTPVATDFDMPNGLCFSPDESVLYIADSGKPRHVRRFKVEADGTLSGGEVFCEIDKGVPDGIRCDADGRLFSTAGDGVHVFAPDGKRIGKILVGETPANCTFGGEDGRTLFLTAKTSLYAIDLKVKGAI